MSRRQRNRWLSGRLGIVIAVLLVLLVVGFNVRTGPVWAAAPIELNFYHQWAGKDAELLQTVVDEFNRSQKEIRVRLIPNTSLEKQLVVIAGGSGLDIGYAAWSNMPGLVEKKVVLPLDSFLADPKSALKAGDFIPAALELGRIEGVQYGLPMTVDIKMMFYNSDILDEKGIPIPETASQFQDMQRRVFDKGPTGRFAAWDSCLNTRGCQWVCGSWSSVGDTTTRSHARLRPTIPAISSG